jgi:predicted secreted protein
LKFGGVEIGGYKMAGRVGRQVTFFFGGDSPADEILGVREKGVECNGEPIDVTSDEDSGVRTLLSNIYAQKEVNVSLSGVTKDTRLKEAWHNDQFTQTCTFTFPDGSSLSGVFCMTSYKETDPYNGAATFEAAFSSSGTITYTAA